MNAHLKPEFIFLSQDDILRTGAGMQTAMETTEKVLGMHATGDVNMPTKVVVDLGERERGRINALPAYLGGDVDCGGIKWVAGFPGNPRKYGIPRANALIILNDCETGMPLAVMDGTYISAMRTGAATGVGAKYLARKDSKTACIIGNGPQAYTQIQALKLTMPKLEEVRCYDIVRDVAVKFAQFCEQEVKLKAIVTENAEKAVVGSDIIVTVTVADEPIVKEKWMSEGNFFAHVGSYQEEEDDVIYNSDKIVVDQWEAVLHRVTPSLAQMFLNGKLPLERIYADIGEVVIGQKKGRESDKERIYYSPIGLGSEDISLAYRVYCMAKEKGLGVSLRLWENEASYKGA